MTKIQATHKFEFRGPSRFKEGRKEAVFASHSNSQNLIAIPKLYRASYNDKHMMKAEPKSHNFK